MLHEIKATMSEVIIQIERKGNEFDVEVNGDFSPGERGSRDRFGAPYEPDINEGFDCIVGVAVEDVEEYDEETGDPTGNFLFRKGDKIELTREEQAIAEDALMDKLKNDRDEVLVDRYLSRMDF